ncbi:GTP-binding protein [Anaerobacillus sp. MEB173]|uniref:GTP-binding protein n=1 Tax=Anaerobacillus sp. MEB173 TaxID=3383345 RepID=UPI003F920DBD
MEKQLPLTVLTGFSTRDRCLFMKRIQTRQQKRVMKILFRQTNIKLTEKVEDPFNHTTIIGETIHDIELNTISNLYTILTRDNIATDFDEIVLDVYPLSETPILIEALISKRKDTNWFLKSHIHLIDAREFWFSYFSEHEISVRAADSNVTMEYTVGEMLINQLETADTIVICHTNRLSHERLGELFSFIRSLQPKATVVTMEEFFQLDDKRKASNDIHTAPSLYTHQMNLFESRNHLKVLGQYGICTYVYRSHFPITLSRLEHFFHEFPNEVFRMKGQCYSPFSQELYVVSQVGSSIQVDTIEMPTWSSNVLSEFLFIGEELDHKDIQKKLDACFEHPSSLGS